MDKLTALTEKFRNDPLWNTPNKDGSHRFDKKIAWIEEMIKSYAKTLNMTTDEVVDLMEKGRDYSWPNYYQEANFHPLDDKTILGVFKTFKDFRVHSKEHWQGYRCPKCGTISQHPQECLHRQENDGVCDWCAYGLFCPDKSVIILESGLKAIPIFDPVPKEA